MNLLDLLQSHASSCPDSEALLAPGYQPMGFGRLWDHLSRIGSQFNEWGIGRGDRVALALPDGPEMATAFLATASFATCAPLNPAFRKSEYEFYLDDLQPQALIVEGKANHPAAEIAESQGILIFDLMFDGNGEAGIFDINPRGDSMDCRPTPNGGPAQAEEVALILHTSGTTSGQKAVPLTHQNICASARNIVHSLELTPQDRCLNVMPLFHIHGLMAGLLSSLAAGGSVVCPPGFVAPAFLDWLGEFHPTWYTAVPTMHQAVLARPELNRNPTGHNSLRFIRSSSASLPPEIASRLEETFSAPVVEAYGMTEAAHQICVNPLHPSKRMPGSVGPISSTEVAIMNPEGEFVASGETGEVVIRGENVMSGYLGSASDNTQAFSGGWFHTGDLGRIDGKGYLFLTGRLKEIINRGGENISPYEVDAALLRHPQVAQAAAFPVPDERMGEEVGAAVVLKNGAQTNAQEIMAFVSDQLADFKVPRQIVFLKELPKGPTGKVQRIGLAEMLGLNKTLQKEAAAFMAPRTDLEKGLARIWEEVLRIERVGVHDDFFAMGGDSILATQVVSRVQARLDVELSIVAFFQESTVAGLAEWIHQSQAATSNGNMAGHPKAPSSIPLRERHGPRPLSFAQERFWFFHQFDPNSPSYNRADVFRLKGSLNRDSLNQALTALVARHEVLRTTYRTVDGIPLQVVQSPRPVEMEAVNLSESLRPSSEEAAQHLVDEEARRPFDLSKDLMLRAKLVRLREEDHVFIIITHHIAADGWSSEVMLHELSEFYAAFSAKRKPTLPELPVQYADYALWQREWLQGEPMEKQLAYWKEKLDGCPALLELPIDHPRPAQQTYRGARCSLVLPKSLGESIKALGQREGCTLFMTLLAVFQAFLYRCTGQDDIVVGTPIAGRTRPEVEKLIGVFINTLALRTDLSGAPTFSELLERVREVTLGAYGNQEIPFEKLLEELNPERDLNHTPMFQVLFNMMNYSKPGYEWPGLTVDPFPLPDPPSKFDLSLYVKEQDDGIHLDWVYNADLFEADTIQRFQKHYQTLLEEVVQDPKRPISTIPILSDAERQKILVEWNDTQADYPAACIHELFEAQAEKTPDNVAYILEDERMTYQELNRRANQVAHHLQTLGIQAEDRVGLFMERSLEMVVGLLGILKAGGAYVPIDPIYPPERIAFMLKDAQASVLLTHTRMAAQLPENGAKVVCLDSDLEKISVESSDNPNTETTPDSLAYLIYTSGSTGTPKGVLGIHRATINRFAWMWRTFPFETGEVTCQRAPMNVVGAVWEMLGPMLQGVPIVIIPDHVVKDPPRLIESLAAHRVTRLATVPSLLHALLDSGISLGSELPNLTYFSTSGEELPLNLARRFVESVPHAKLVNLYGSTEVASDSTYFEFTQDEQLASVPIGRPIANTQAYILDQNLELAPIGVPGELHIGGVGLARGYHERPDLTAEMFIQNPFDPEPNARLYKTGDLAWYLPNGDIAFLGRTDYQVKIRGFRIELGEIESVLEQHDAIKAAAVTTNETSPGENRLIAYVVSEGGFSLSTDDLHKYLTQKLPNYMIPARFMFMDELPKNPHGKVDRRALPAPDSARPDLEKPFICASTPIEKDLAKIWIDLLQVDQIGIHDNFFELGGHSLMATRVMGQVNDKLGVNIPLITIFESPTIAQMAETILNPTRTQVDEKELERLLDKVERASQKNKPFP